MISLVIKVCAMLVIGVIITAILKEYKSEYAIVFSVCCGIFVLVLIVNYVMPNIKSFYNTLNISTSTVNYISVIIKALCIAYLCEFCADTCRDFGQSSLAVKAELVGKCAIFTLCIPLIYEILETAIAFCKK